MKTGQPLNGNSNPRVVAYGLTFRANISEITECVTPGSIKTLAKYLKAFNVPIMTLVGLRILLD